jgi:hypothetical protein
MMDHRDLRYGVLPPETPSWTYKKSPSVGLRRQKTIDSVRAALHFVAPHYIENLVLHYVHNEQCKDIARRLGVAQGTVLSRLHRAREQFAGSYHRLKEDPSAAAQTDLDFELIFNPPQHIPADAAAPGAKKQRRSRSLGDALPADRPTVRRRGRRPIGSGRRPSASH